MPDLEKRNKQWTPSLPERGAHRDWIGGRVFTLLSHYFRHDDPVELTGAIARDWADVLEGLQQDYIYQACLDYMREHPSRRPTPGDIYQRARALMPKPQVVHSRPMTREESEAAIVDREKINPDRARQAQQIIESVYGTRDAE